MRNPPEQQPSKKRWYELLPPWISATSAIVATIVGVWVLFFSPASKALVDYLHSEITVRNNRIMFLEAHENELRTSISNRETELKSLGIQRDSLQQQIAKDEAERNDLRARLDTIKVEVAQKEFLLVKQEIATMLAGTIGDLLPLSLVDEAYSEKGTRPRREEMWTNRLNYIRKLVEQLPEKDKSLGQEVVRRFIEQCEQLSKDFIEIPAIKSPRLLSSGDEYQRDQKIFSQKLDALVQKTISADQKIDTCFKAVVQ